MISQESNEYISLKLENDELKEKIHRIQEEYEKYFIAHQLKKPNKNYKKIPLERRYGAVEYIKNSLPYRLGSVFIKNTKSIRKIHELPFIILNEYNKPAEDKNINIEECYDYDEAMKLKKHLSYKIGVHILSSLDSYENIPSLPFKLMFELYRFKKDKKE